MAGQRVINGPLIVLIPDRHAREIVPRVVDLQLGSAFVADRVAREARA